MRNGEKRDDQATLVLSRRCSGSYLDHVPHGVLKDVDLPAPIFDSTWWPLNLQKSETGVPVAWKV